eukprot:8090-Eustigmatos_ZCMA.PRE.1
MPQQERIGTQPLPNPPCCPLGLCLVNTPEICNLNLMIGRDGRAGPPLKVMAGDGAREEVARVLRCRNPFELLKLN